MNINCLRKAPARAVFGFAAILLSPTFQPGAWGQGPQDNGGPPPPQFGGGQRMGGGRAPFATGTVSAVDATAGTITIASPFGGNSQTIKTSSTTQIVSQVTATVADLKTGDQVQVQGIPTGITASALSIGQSPFPTGGFGGPGGRAPNGGAGAAGGQGSTAGGQGGASASNSFAVASGTVSSTSPLTISLGSDVSLTLKMAASAKITKFSTVALSALKVGDRIVGLGQTGDDGTFTATTVAVNMEMGNMGFGQRGRGGFNGNGRNRRNRQNDGQAQNGSDQNAMPMPPPQNGAPADVQAMMMPPPDNQAQMPPPPTNGDAGQ